jgi:hypothetical protein
MHLIFLKQEWLCESEPSIEGWPFGLPNIHEAVVASHILTFKSSLQIYLQNP